MSDPWNVVEEQVYVTTRRFVLGCLLVMCLAGPAVYAGIQYARGQETSITFCPPHCTAQSAGALQEPWTMTTSSTIWATTIVGPVAVISAAGDVTIDWPAAEAMRAREYVGYDPTTVAVVRLMFAVRDGTWKPREPK